jgi:hypothetical protein
MANMCISMFQFSCAAPISAPLTAQTLQTVNLSAETDFGNFGEKGDLEDVLCASLHCYLHVW